MPKQQRTVVVIVLFFSPPKQFSNFLITFPVSKLLIGTRDFQSPDSEDGEDVCRLLKNSDNHDDDDMRRPSYIGT